MKKILGLDLGTTSIGWAYVNEAENDKEQSSIVKLGVRVNPLTVDELTNFDKGKSITTNADRTLKRSMRRNLQRYKLRREALRKLLCEYGIINEDFAVCEQGNFSTFQTFRARAKAASEEIPLEEFARVLFMINKKRGYKSSRKAQGTEEGTLVDSMDVAKLLYEQDLTPGQYVLSLLKKGKHYIPDFYRSDLQSEFDRIWDIQKQYYPDILTDEFKAQISGKGKMNTSKIFLGKYKIYTADNKGKDKKLQAYIWRDKALREKLPQEEMAFVLAEVNGQLNNSSGYLGAISDRSKNLFFNKKTVGEDLMEKLDSVPGFSTKNEVYYRQDYLDEFEKIWEVQRRYHKELTPVLKKEVRDVVIFYQRPLRSQKWMLAACELEPRCKVCPKSSPIFQAFKIWQVLNNVELSGAVNRPLEESEKKALYEELWYKKDLDKKAALKILFDDIKGLDLNFKKLEGNATNAVLMKAYAKILEMSGHGEYDFEKMPASQSVPMIKEVFEALGIKTDILSFDACVEGKAIERQPFYELWHLLYSYEGDNSKSGVESLLEKLWGKWGFEKEYARVLAGVSFTQDYGSLSAKAMRKILPYLKEGNAYSQACELAGYRHSKRSLTKDELESRELADHLEELKKNSLRNPVVEKILNQMVNVVNAVVDEYGRPDEVRIEMARELKKSADERAKDTERIGKATKEYEEYRRIIQNEFGYPHVSKNDIIRYRLYKELEPRGYKTFYTNTYIPKEKLFTRDFDIEHIIPKARLFDDSFSNKTLEARDANIEKSNMTAYDYVLEKYGESGAETYKIAVEDMFKNGHISKAKKEKLLKKGELLGEGFIERDLRDSQYIARKAKEMLESLVRRVVSTTGSITDRLRQDWELVDVMQELNWNKYDCLGLTEVIENREGQPIRRIKDWTKRNDHRHHAMDALTIAFTKPSYIQYLNNLNARSDKSGAIYAIEQKELKRNEHGKLRFKPPMENLRQAAKVELESILVSIKAKNKVVTRNVNKSKTKDGFNKTVQLTPRGQLHKETIYGQRQRYVAKMEKVGAGFTEEYIGKVAQPSVRRLLLKRLAEFGNDPKKAFTGKNSLEKNPIYLNAEKTAVLPAKVKVVTMEPIYTIRKDVAPDLKIDKVVDAGIRRLLQARLDEFGGDAKKAFSNLDENPIWINESKGIRLKKVTITGISNAISLHNAMDNSGKPVLDAAGNAKPVDFVNTGNNHHIAIYLDENGNYQEKVVSFYEAVYKASAGLPVIDKEYRAGAGWKFLFTMKQNEYFVFPDEKTGFDPANVDLMNPKNYAMISPHLFRVQKLTSKDYFFRHHLETNVENSKELFGVTWKRISSLENLKGIIKLRVNHLGQIVSVGEY